MKATHLNNLRALEAVLRTGGLRSAAAELGVTAAAVGQQIRSLEGYIGHSLLDRSANGATPSDFAKRVSSDLTRHISGLADVLGRLRTPASSNRLSISMLATFAEIWFPRHLGSLFAELPEVDLRLDTSQRVADLQTGEFDFAVRHMGSPSEDEESLVLFADQTTPLCTPEFAARYELGPDTTSLKHVPVAEVDFVSTSPDVFKMARWCEHFDVEPPNLDAGFMRLQNTGDRRMALAGLALYQGGLFEAYPDLDSGRLIMPFELKGVVEGSYSFHLVWRKGMRLSSIQKSFIDWMDVRAKGDRDAVERFLALQTS
jgi:DNA-binding transcriptional LysR family regulator